MKLIRLQLDWLNKVVDGIWQLNGCGLVDVDGNVYCSFQELIKIPVNFGYVSEDFYCHSNKLTSLSGAPREVGKSFHCGYNNLISLSGGPSEVGKDFWCTHNNLTSLSNGPREVGGNFCPGDGKFDCPSEFALWWISRTKYALYQINNPSDKAIQLHNMLWEI